MKKGLFSVISLTFAVLYSTIAGATSLDTVDTEQLIRGAELIFEGTVTQVKYRNSQVDAPGQVSLPHTFVTFQIQTIYKGRAADGRTITLRFQGGADGGGKNLMIPGIPLFDVGDRDILFVHTNGQAMCPLVGWEQGRFRVVNGEIYNDGGYEIWLTERQTIATGEFHPIEQALKHRIGNSIIQFEHAEPKHSETWIPPSGWHHLDALSFRKYIDYKVRQGFTPLEIAALPAERSVSVYEHFTVEDAKPVRSPIAH